MAGRELGRGGIEGGKGTASGKHAPAAWLIKICGKRGTKHCAYSKYSQHKSPETNNAISNVLYSIKKQSYPDFRPSRRVGIVPGCMEGEKVRTKYGLSVA